MGGDLERVVVGRVTGGTSARSGAVRRLGPMARALLSAILLAAAAPPSPLPLLVFVALVPLAGALYRLPVTASHHAFRLGVGFGAAYWALTLVWIPQVALRVGLWAAVGWIAVVLTLAALAGLGAWATHRLLWRGLPLPLALAVGWGGVEYLRTAGLGPLSFPWMGLALPLAGTPPLMQGAAWVGEAGVALAVAALGGFLAHAGFAPPRRRYRAWLLGAVVVLAAGWAGGGRMRVLETEPTLRALVLQPNVPLAVKRGPADTALRHSVEAIDALVAEAAAPGVLGGRVDVAVLPETAIPLALDGPASADERGLVARWSESLAAPLLVGAFAQGAGRGANALFLATSDARAVWPIARKMRLVPGVEWVPGSGDGLEAGIEVTPLPLPTGGILGGLICLESASAEVVAELAAAGVSALVNVTNDAWLAEAPRWTRSAAFQQHPAHLAWRAVEAGIGAVRVGNNGRTETVDPFGRRALVLPPHEAGWGVAQVSSLRARAGVSPLVVWLPRLAALACIVGCLLPVARRLDPPLTL